MFFNYLNIKNPEIKNKIYIPPQKSEVSWNHIFLIKKSVIRKIYLPVIFVTLWTASLKVFYDSYKEREFIKTVFFPTSLLTYIGMVLSLLLVFRNNSAYDRYYEGRKSWASILNHARNLSRHIWIYVDIKDNDKKRDEKLNLKKGVMRLIIALVISIRHSLRGEFGWDYDDLSELVKHVPRFNSLFTTAPVEVLKILPLELAYHIEGFLFSQKKIPVPMLNQSYASLNTIIENFTTCERILSSPIPTIYGIHIKHVLLIYLLTLPLQIIPNCGWASIIIVLLTSFTLLGIEAISTEIENPFGSDKNDLKLDDFCQQVQDEINGMMKYFPSSVACLDWFECEEIEEKPINSVTVNIKDIDRRTDYGNINKRNSTFNNVFSNGSSTPKPEATPAKPAEKKPDAAAAPAKSNDKKKDKKKPDNATAPAKPNDKKKDGKKKDAATTPAKPDDKKKDVATAPAKPDDKKKDAATAPAKPDDKKKDVATAPAKPDDKKKYVATAPAKPDDKKKDAATAPAKPEDKKKADKKSDAAAAPAKPDAALILKKNNNIK